MEVSIGSFSERIQSAKAEWKALDDDERQAYNDRASGSEESRRDSAGDVSVDVENPELPSKSSVRTKCARVWSNMADEVRTGFIVYISN